jgi:hypothetical protein
MRAWLGIAALTTIVVVSSCGTEGAAAAVRSGVKGVVQAGPTCPVETEESPCPDRPVEDANVIAKTRSGQRVASTRTDDAGRFRIHLRPGKYRVTAESDTVFGCDEQDVVVKRRSYTETTVTCDTGIR